MAQKHAAELQVELFTHFFIALNNSRIRLPQDVKDKAKAFIKRKIDQLTLEHAAALASSEQKISLLTAARDAAERERDERDRLLEEMRSAITQRSAAVLPVEADDSSAADDVARERAEVEELRSQLAMVQRQLADAVERDMCGQKQLESERLKHAAELHAERLRAEVAVRDAQAQFSAAHVDAQTAALSAAAIDESISAAKESARITSELNYQLERESRELLQVMGSSHLVGL
jgi:hypothetical protein